MSVLFAGSEPVRYELSDSAMTWDAAVSYCRQSVGGQLVVFENVSQAASVIDSFQSLVSGDER